MIESPVLNELIAETQAKTWHKGILGLLKNRFGSVPADLAEMLRGITDEEKLQKLLNLSSSCASLEEFRHHLAT